MRSRTVGRLWKPLLSSDVHAVFEALNDRFAERLGLDRAQIESAHLATVVPAREREPARA
jgi:hypothetical protein